MRIAVQRETGDGETRVAMTPDVAGRLVRAGHDVVIETDAGHAAGFLDPAYEKAGARIAPDARAAADPAQAGAPPANGSRHLFNTRIADFEDVPVYARTSLSPTGTSTDDSTTVWSPNAL